MAIKIIDKSDYERQIARGSEVEEKLKAPKSKRLAPHAKVRGDSGLLREIELMMRVNDHPNIIKLYRVLDAEETTYVIM